MKKTRFLILGGGFGGLYAALEFEKRRDLISKSPHDLAPFRCKTLSLLASIGRRTSVVRILGINFSGFVVWWLWRTIYLLKLPPLRKEVASRSRLDPGYPLLERLVQYLHEAPR
jgi:NADH dehydrogenase FAD-containing subunit